MWPRWTISDVPRGVALWLGMTSLTTAQTAAPTVLASDVAVLQALRADPLTAPYPLATDLRDGRVVLRGVVGSKEAHDAAVRIAMEVTPSIDDRLVIDTVLARRIYVPFPPPGFSLGRLPFRFNDPGWYWGDGFDPPLITYPPWWGELTARRQAEASEAPPPPQPEAIELPPDTVEMVIDPTGMALLRGTVPTLADRIAIGQRIAQTPGVTGVINQLVARDEAGPTAGPPPPPRPASNGPAIDVGTSSGLEGRVQQALARRPALTGLAITAKVSEGVATLSGRVPTVYEAMLAFRAAQQVPGVRAVVDRLGFRVPDGEAKNPLLEKGRPEDVEPYLAAHVRDQLGDTAHLDRVRLVGDTLELRGTLNRADDRARVEAILRSMPVLRGFRLDLTFVAE